MVSIAEEFLHSPLLLGANTERTERLPEHAEQLRKQMAWEKRSGLGNARIGLD